MIWQYDTNILATFNTAIAAFLYLRKTKLTNVIFNNGRGLFLFYSESTPEDIEEQYNSTEFPNYFQAYRTMLTRLKVMQ